jgi:hypothetical protein
MLSCFRENRPCAGTRLYICHLVDKWYPMWQDRRRSRRKPILSYRDDSKPKPHGGHNRRNKMKKLLVFVLAGALLISGITTAFAQSATGGTPSLGMDMWNGYNAQRGLYTPHLANVCTAGESFVAIGPDPSGTTLVGYCIEINPRNSGTLTDWVTARTTCSNAGKRLPEPMEWQYSCRQGDFNHPNNSFEWISNFEYPTLGSGSLSPGLISAWGGPFAGEDFCSDGSASYTNIYSVNFGAFRCVH